jgi:hypothetical protein
MRGTAKLLLIALLLSACRTGYASGLVYFINAPLYGAPTPITTNGPSGSGLTASGGNQFYYGLFVAPYGTTDSDLLNPIWTFTGTYATNTSFGQLTGGPQALVNGWEPGITMSYVIAGWSANLGHDWSSIEDHLGSNDWLEEGFFGQSNVGWGTAGGRLPNGVIRLPFPLFASTSPAEGNLSSGFVLYSVPEPGVSSLSVLALAIGLLRRNSLVSPKQVA